MKKIALFLAVLMIATLGLTACSSGNGGDSSSSSSSSAANTSSAADDSSSSAAAGDDVLIMATEAGFKPYEYLSGSDIVGVDVDIANEIAKDMGKTLQIMNMDFDGALLAAQNGTADFVAAGVSITPERQEVLDFSIEYAVSNNVVIVNKETKRVTSPEDITGKIVGVQQANVADLVVTEDYETQEVKRYTKFLQAAEDLKNDKIDCIVMDILPAQELVAANPELEILDGELFTDKYAIGVQKGNTEMLEAINATLQRLIDEGKIEEYTINHSTQDSEE